MQAAIQKDRCQQDRYEAIDRLLAISVLSKRLAQRLALQTMSKDETMKGGNADEPHERTGRRYYRIA